MPHSTVKTMAPVPVTKRTAERRAQDWQQLQRLDNLPLYRIPSEIVLKILHNLDLEHYPSLIVAAMPLLRRRGIVENMSTARLRSLLMEPRQGFYASHAAATDPSDERYLPPVFRRLILHRLSPREEAFRTLTVMPLRLRGGFEKLPAELRNNIFGRLDPSDKANLVIASFRFSDEDVEWLTHEKV